VVAAGAFAGVSGAVSAKAPSPTLRGQAAGAAAGAATVSSQTNYQPPAYCSPCLFYSGDFNPLDPNADALANENDLSVSSASVYTAVRPNRDWVVTGLFVNTLSPASVINPTLTPWDVRTGVSTGNGGTDYASGVSVTTTFTPTGRSAFGVTEYTLFAHLSSSVYLHAGVTYFINVQPQCTSGAVCNTRYFESNVEPFFAPMNHVGPPNVNDDSFFNSSYFGANYQPATDFGPFDQFSFGLVGRPKLSKA
jgi:hypothetical protein